ncbi:MAG TPA: alpha/beta hydrolase [Thermopetrobacter sp.]|nr:alpha/beta hydrolase [Thermopetrobacter sp.]
MPYFTHQGLRIHYETFGDVTAGTPVLLLHGFASSARINWVSPSWTEALTAAGFAVIAPDHRGHGQSDKPHDPAAYSLDIMAADALALMDRLNVPAAHVMGYSMGARVATVMALEWPDRVQRLILSGMAGSLLTGVGKSEEIAAALEADDPSAISGARGLSFRQFAEKAGNDLKALAAVMRAERRAIAPEELRRLAMPVLVTVGDDDPIAGPLEPLAQAIPHAETFVIEGRNHMNAVGDARHKRVVVEFLRSQPDDGQ